MVDRLAQRERPAGMPIMHQTWGKLLFMHWPIPEDLLRPLIPSRLQIDTYEGQAWIAVVPFTMWGIRPVFLPAVPGLSESHELNVRTYVHLDGVPGVWFHSLDASNAAAVWTARRLFHLAYYQAEQSLTETGDRIHYTSRRTHPGAPPASFEANWSYGKDLPPSDPDSLEFFLTERLCLYAAEGSTLYRARIFHPPWRLREATVFSYASSMVASHGLPEPEGAPLLHYGGEMHVEVWPLKKV